MYNITYLEMQIRKNVYTYKYVQATQFHFILNFKTRFLLLEVEMNFQGYV